MRSRSSVLLRLVATFVIASLGAAACSGPIGSQAPSAGSSASAGTPGALPTLAPPPIEVTGVPANVHAETAKAAATWIGPAGGTLATTAADGTAYVLDIPEYAVREATAITMTPITSVDELGLSGGLAGAVFLQPAGLALAVPATLTITTATAAPAGTRLVGFDVPDGGGPIDLVPATSSGTVTVAVFHFSAPGAGFGTTQDLAQLGAGANSTRMAGLLTRLLADPVPWDNNTLVANGLLIDVMWAGVPLASPPQGGLRDAILNVAGDVELLRAIKDWRTFIFLMNLWAHKGDVSLAMAEGITYVGGARQSHTVAYVDGQLLVGDKVFAAIEGNKALCESSHDLRALANVWFWAGLGERYAPGARDWESAAHGCAILTAGVANLPTNLQAGGADSLGMTFVLKFSDGTQVPADVEVTLAGVGFTFASSGSNSLTAGVAGTSTLTAGVVATQGPPYSLSFTACWVLDGLKRNLCNTESRPFGSGATGAPSDVPGTAGAGEAPQMGRNWNVSASCDGLYGTGTGTLTQNGWTVTLSWSVTMAPDPDLAATSDCWKAYQDGGLPNSGTMTGTIVVGPTGAELVDLILDASPCRPVGKRLDRIGVGSTRITIPINYCAGASRAQYLASWAGP